jgi:hypothetical protein
MLSLPLVWQKIYDEYIKEFATLLMETDALRYGYYNPTADGQCVLTVYSSVKFSSNNNNISHVYYTITV